MFPWDNRQNFFGLKFLLDKRQVHNNVDVFNMFIVLFIEIVISSLIGVNWILITVLRTFNISVSSLV